MTRLDLCLDRHNLTAEAEAIVACFGVTLATVEGKGRRPNAVFARHRIMLLLRDKAGMSYPEIGRVVGGKDHSSVMYAVASLRPWFQWEMR